MFDYSFVGGTGVEYIFRVVEKVLAFIVAFSKVVNTLTKAHVVFNCNSFKW